MSDVSRPPMRLLGPVLDAADPLALADFYQRLLGWEITEREGPRAGASPTDGWAIMRSPDRTAKLEFQYEAHYVPPVWPPVDGEPQMMIHIDIGVEDLDAGVAWAVAAGARVAPEQPQKPGEHVIMLDPAGHVFCMCRVAPR